MKALVTGSEGFIGSYLCPYLKEQGHEVIGDRHVIPGFDICDYGQVDRLVALASPDWVFHLAAQSNVTRSWKEPRLTFEVNVIGTLNLLDAVRALAPKARVVLACTSAQYGQYQERITELHPLKPLSPYAVSKAAIDLLGYCYHKSYNLAIIRARIFGTTGPGKTGDAVSDFCRSIASAENPIKVGNLDAIRDLTDVHDTVRALVLLMEKGKPEAYNICSGKGYRMDEILERLLKLAKREWNVVIDDHLLRPVDEPVIVGNNTKIKRLGWEPEIPIQRTLGDTLDFWRERRGNESRVGTFSR